LRDAKLADNQTFKLYEERLVADKGRSRLLKSALESTLKRRHISVALEKERVVVEQLSL